jgi:uncharacterized membrane protein (UPF0127 family)
VQVRFLVAALAVGAVGAAGAAAAFLDGPSESPAFPRGTATIATARGDVVVRVEIASSGPERARGLMHRESLDADAGMVFRFPRPTSGGFWMKSTLIPLDIAFYDERGIILRILQMTPCRADPCRIYAPGVSYRAALEVNRGALDRWGVRVGDRITVSGEAHPVGS